MVLFVMLYQVVLTFESVNKTLKFEHNEQYFPVVPFIMLHVYKVVLTFESVGKILKCDHSNESYGVGGCNAWVSRLNPTVWSFNWNYWAVVSCGALRYSVY